MKWAELAVSKEVARRMWNTLVTSHSGLMPLSVLLFMLGEVQVRISHAFTNNPNERTK